MTMQEDVPRVVLDQLRGHQTPVSVEFMLDLYVFDFPMTRHVIDGRVYMEVGRNDVDMPLVLSGGDGRLYILNDGQAVFVNASFPQFLQAVAAYQRLADTWDDDTPNETRLDDFDATLLGIDPDALGGGPEAFWSTVREEMGYGII